MLVSALYNSQMFLNDFIYFAFIVFSRQHYFKILQLMNKNDYI